MRYAIATPHQRATAAGEAAFRAGGNALDAALAAAGLLAVAYPHMCSIGGDAIALVHAPDGSVTAVTGAGAAPAAADAEALRARHGASMPWDGPDTVTVPGAVDAWGQIAALGARRPWAEALGPAIAAADGGVPVARRLAEASRAQPAVMGELEEGAPLRQGELAASLRAIAAEGPRALYEGELADALAAGSPLAAADLAAHRSGLAVPLARAFHDVELLTSPPPSQGYALLRVTGAIGALPQVPEPLGLWAPTLAHLFAAVSAERDRLLADPVHSPVDVAALLDDDRLLEAARATAMTAGRSGDTVAVLAADSDGHAVSLIQSVFGAFGAGIVEPRTGILLHNRGASFSLDPASPNVLAPGKRPLHTLMPAMVRRGGRLELVLGTMGGRAQFQIHAQLLFRLLRGAAPGAAVAAPRFVVDGRSVLAEAGAVEAAGTALRLAGLDVTDVGEQSEAVGHAQAIRIGAGLEAGSDPRADGAAAVGEV